MIKSETQNSGDKKQPIILALKMHVSCAVYSNHDTRTVQPEAVAKGVHKIFSCLGTKIAVKWKSLNMLCDVLYHDSDPANTYIYR